MAFTYPTQYDATDELAAQIGEFWHTLHFDPSVWAGIGARGQAELQAVNNFNELLACASRYQVPVYHTITFYPLHILKSEGEDGDMLGSKQWESPGMVVSSTLSTTPDNAAVCLFEKIDYDLDAGMIVFRTDPFLNPAIPQTPIYDSSGNITDWQIDMWFFRPQFDLGLMDEQYGYAINFQLGGQVGKDLLNVYFDAIVSGTAKEQAERAISLLTGIPLAYEDEVVQLITADSTSQIVATDNYVYRVPFGAAILVTVGQSIVAGQAICDALQFFDCNRGIVPTADQCPGVTLGPGMIDLSIAGPLTFQNESLPVIVTTDMSYTKIELALDGDPGDVDDFWDLAHTRGIAAGDTLAELLDTRTIKVGQPTAANLPANLNPLELVVQNILRYSGRLCVTKSPLFPATAPGIDQGTFLRKIIPPNELLLIVDITGPGVFTTTNAAAI